MLKENKIKFLRNEFRRNEEADISDMLDFGEFILTYEHLRYEEFDEFGYGVFISFIDSINELNKIDITLYPTMDSVISSLKIIERRGIEVCGVLIPCYNVQSPWDSNLTLLLKEKEKSTFVEIDISNSTKLVDPYEWYKTRIKDQ